jgi:hypothetical protein
MKSIKLISCGVVIWKITGKYLRIEITASSEFEYATLE